MPRWNVNHSVLCGDFNSAPRDSVYETLVVPKNAEWGYQDAWVLAHQNQLHSATCGILTTNSGEVRIAETIFVAGSIATRVERDRSI